MIRPGIHIKTSRTHQGLQLPRRFQAGQHLHNIATAALQKFGVHHARPRQDVPQRDAAKMGPAVLMDRARRRPRAGDRVLRSAGLLLAARHCLQRHTRPPVHGIRLREQAADGRVGRLQGGSLRGRPAARAGIAGPPLAPLLLRGTATQTASHHNHPPPF